MPITTNCTNCAALFRLPEEMAGKKVRCQKCAHVFTVPVAEEPPAAPPAHAAPSLEIDDAPAPEAPTAVTSTPTANEPANAVKAEADEAASTRLPPLSKSASRPPVKPRRRDEAASSGSGVMMLIVALLLGFGTLSCFACAGVAGWYVYSETEQPRIKVPPPPGPIAVKDKMVEFKDKFDGKRDDLRPRPDDFKDGFKDRPIEPLPAGNLVTIVKPGVTHVSDSALTEADPVNKFGRRFRGYSVQLVAGQEYQFDMRSSQIDPHLYVYDDKNMLVAENDDFNFLDSQIRFRAARTGTYRIEAASHRGLETGPFRLSVGRLDGGQPPNFDKK